MKTNQIIRVLAMTTLLLALAACGGAPDSGTAATGGDTAGAGGGETAAAGAAVSIADLAYSPAEIEVAAGESVTWTNEDSAPHTVSFDDEALTDSEEMATGDEFSATFDTAGSYSYVCAIHPDMKGSVTVQ